VRLYDLREWKRVRAEHLTREPLCVLCLAAGRKTPGHHVDHITPISQGGEWFDSSNLQSLCHECHSLKTLGDKGHAVRMGASTAGNPIDPAHPWNASER
jgi:5-methylcytosine-specific restriction enzyme A